MGLFDKRDKKRKDDFDSPNESIDLDEGDRNTPAPAKPVAAPAAAAAPSLASPPAAAKPAPAPAPAAKPAAPAPPPPDTDNYGIDKAIELMRTLPSENIQLVVQVVKFSLESVGIKLPVIIQDAIRRQGELRGRVDVLKGEITELEQEIAQRKAEIEKHEADHRETTMVRERLEMAEGGKAPAAAVASAAAPAPAAEAPHPTRTHGTTGPLAPLSPAAPILPKK